MTRNISTGTVRIRKNDDSLDLYTMDMNSESMKTEIDLNIFLDPADQIKVFTESITGFDYPMAVLEIYEIQD